MWGIGIAIAVITIGIFKLFRCKPKAEIVELPEKYWGPGEAPTGVDHTIRPFKIAVPEEVITDLKQRLAKTRPLPEPLEGAAWTYGLPSSYLKTIIDYWQNKYDWFKRQNILNEYPQFKTNIQGLDIHFYHVKPTIPKDSPHEIKVLPLLLVHGWPGSVVEFQKILPLLVTPRPGKDFVFEVIAPSLPGYGFSDAAVRPGLGAPQMAVIMKNLMTRLGFEKFYTQGGDWGSMITTTLAALYPKHVYGMHVNMSPAARSACTIFWSVVGSYFPSLVIEKKYHSLMYPLKDHYCRLIEETGYFHIQATKPDTVGTALMDSPAGLAAYILEKFSTWTNPEYRFRADGGLLEKYTLDELLDNVTLYWVTNTITTSMRIYAETFSKETRSLGVDKLPVLPPSAVAAFPCEITYTPESFLRRKLPNLVRFTNMPRGGHFAAFEEPELLANDFWNFVTAARKQTHVSAQQAVPRVPEEWWGPGKATAKIDKDIRPYKIDVPERIIADLRDRLARTRTLRKRLEGAAWTYGISTDYPKTIIDYWQNKYNWSKRQALLNKYPQFKTNIQGLYIHFYHVKPTIPKDRKDVKVLPLLLVHGWGPARWSSSRRYFQSSPPLDPIRTSSLRSSLPLFPVTDSRPCRPSRTRCNLVQNHKMQRGGHFAAMDEPKLLADELWLFVAKVRAKPEAAKNAKEEVSDKKP